MDIKTWFFGGSGSKRTALRWFDDESFKFVKLPIKRTFLALMEGDKIVKAWSHYFNLQFDFNGFKDISGDRVTIVYDRDILYDPYKIVEGDNKTKPDMTGKFNQPFIKEKATSVIYEIQHQKKSNVMMDRVTIGLLGVLGVEALVLVLGFAGCGG